MSRGEQLVMDLGEAGSISLLAGLLGGAETLFVKKLSRNDRDWANFSHKHQSGLYVPPKERDSGFFPELTEKVRAPGEAAIRESYFDTYWPQFDVKQKSRVVHYTSKGGETHLTGIPKQAFCDLSPASMFVMGKCRRADNSEYYSCLTIDSLSDEYEHLVETLSIKPDFVSGIFSPTEERRSLEQRVLGLIDEILRALEAGRLAELADSHTNLPPTAELAARARTIFLKREGLKDLDPYAMRNPGDAILEISRRVEYELFKELQLRSRAIRLVRLVVGDDPKATSLENVIGSLVRNFPKIDELLLGAAQERKSRAGYSFEHQVEQMLKDGRIPFEKQVVLESKRRPDFILPTKALYNDATRKRDEALVLSLKTTVRERWKQVGSEVNNCDLFLATVDETISSNAIAEMASAGIILVVPESLKNSNITEYEKQSNVIDFKTFFVDAVRAKRFALWKERGIEVA